MIKGVLFDVDGTLVLSNDAHARAWEEAFAESGYEIQYDKIRRLIGMGGDKLIATLCPGLSDTEGDGKKIKGRRKEIFLDKYASQLQAAPGTRQLIEAVRSAGLKMMVASSATSDELGILLQAAGVDDLLTDATTSDDAENSKPDPDIVQVALRKIGLASAEVVMLGDTPFDIEAAAKAGVKCVALRCGGWEDSELHDAWAIFDDPADVLAHRTDFGY
jgi:HAD superfamily hydrolase (TIGR01509 family)